MGGSGWRSAVSIPTEHLLPNESLPPGPGWQPQRHPHDPRGWAGDPDARGSDLVLEEGSLLG